MHNKKVLTFIAVFLGVLVLLLMTQTEGFDARQKSAQFMAYLNAQKDAAAATRTAERAAIAEGPTMKGMQDMQKAAQEFHQIVSDEALKKGFDPRIADMAYWEQHYGKGQPAPTPQPAVKNMPAVAPSPSIVKKAPTITPSQSAPATKVQNAIPTKTK